MTTTTWAVLRDRDAALYLTGVVVSGFGTSALWLVSGVWVKDLTGSDGLAALCMLAMWAPTLAGPLLGTLADRLPRRPLLIASSLFLAALLPVLLTVDSPGLVWLVLGVLFVYGATGVVNDAAEAALVASTLPATLLGDFNGLRMAITEGMKLVAPLAGAGLYTVYGGPAVVLLDAGTFVVAAGIYAGLRTGGGGTRRGRSMPGLATGVGRAPGAKDGTRSLPARARGAGGALPSGARGEVRPLLTRARRTRDALPARARRAMGLLPGRARDAGHVIPGRARDAGGSFPGRTQDAGRPLPEQTQNTARSLPARAQDPGLSTPEQAQDPACSLPEQTQAAAHPLPERAQNDTHPPQPSRVEHPSPHRRPLSPASAGARHLWAHPRLRPLVLAGGFSMLCAGLNGALLYAVIDGLGHSPTFAGVLYAVQGAGSVSVGLLSGRALRWLGERRFAAWGIAVTAVAVALRAVPSDAVAFLTSAAIGAGLPCVLIAALTAVQRETPDEMLGRTVATANTLVYAPNVIGLGAGAALVELVDYRPVLVALGMAWLGTALPLLRPGTTERPAR